MRLLHILLLLAMLGLFSTPARAQASDAAVYEVTDVGADVTADSAVHARDQALAQAQRTAFEQLLQRLGTDSAMAAKLGDDDIAALVQSFEVQNERSSKVRYIGTFTVQFRPNAVRTFLGDHNAPYTDARSKPVIVLPVLVMDGHPMLWEENTKWRVAWDNGARSNGLVPVVIPQGGLDDIALLSTEEAVSGKSDSIKALTAKYQAGGAFIAILNGNISKPRSTLAVELWRYDAEGAPSSPVNFGVSIPADKTTIETVLGDAVKQARAQIEKQWKQEAKQGTEPGAEDLPITEISGQPTIHLPVTVPVANLAEWEQIRHRLDHVPNIAHAEIVTLARGMTSIEIEFRGDLQQLQSALAGQNLSLNQNKTNGAWTLQPLAPG